MTQPANQRILVIDDEERVRGFIMRVLRHSGYQVQDAANGQVALGYLDAQHYDLMITDLKMPVMDGLSLLRFARDHRPNLRVLVLTAYGTIESAVEAMKLGAIDYMTKPFGVAELEAKVARCLAEPEAPLEEDDPSGIGPLVELNRILSNQSAPDDRIDRVMHLLVRTFHPDAAYLALLQQDSQEYTLLGHSGGALGSIGIELPSPWQLMAMARQETPWRITDIVVSGGLSGQAITLPLVSGKVTLGVLILYRQAPPIRANAHDMQLLQLFASQLALTLFHLRMRTHLHETFRELKETTLPAVQALFEALGTYDGGTGNHSARVARYARILSQAVGLGPEDVERIAIGGLLHDLGKLGVGDNTLHKSGSLTSTEFDRVRLHPVMGARILEGLDSFAAVVPLILYHHERYDGTGYPHGLKGDQIPQGARIIATVDTYDSMTSDRPYRSSLSIDDAIMRLRAAAGSQLDGELVETWVRVVEQDRLAVTSVAELSSLLAGTSPAIS